MHIGEITAANVNEARIVAFITFAFRRNRLQYLFEVLKALGEYKVAELEAVVITDSESPDDHAEIYRLCRHVFGRGKTLRVLREETKDNPFELTWSHKPHLKEAYLDNKRGFTHFIYLEDDMRLTFSNFCYFVHYENDLSEHGLIPSFMRYEYNHTVNDICLSDHQGPVDLSNRPFVTVDNLKFICTDYPYIAFFIMTRRHMGEYIESNSFDMERSTQTHPWWIAERAAMGLTWENVPSGFTSRYAIAIQDGKPLPECYVHHTPNNYTNDYGEQRKSLAKLSPDQALLNRG
ncbi:hypothetical protein G8E10_09680 [Rhizobiaceae bacterium CRRU44]|uniref:Uncharacterized protein n=1 Tax=Ferranicluibacter rubi TaxID=2715133 RepID=A0AA43ZDU6_9HYPH|nr:hypothetical protein [Ferranicluibacter rubi]NHT76003.1 hypothetical protein [Ferranicluibacter rubi]